MRTGFDQELVEGHAEGVGSGRPSQPFTPHFIHDEQQANADKVTDSWLRHSEERRRPCRGQAARGDELAQADHEVGPELEVGGLFRRESQSRNTLPLERRLFVVIGISTSSQILEQHEQVVRISGRLDKVEPVIERARLIILRVHGEGANTRDVGGLQRSEHRVFQQTGPQTLAVMAGGHRQPGEQHHRYRMPWQAFAQPGRRVRVLHLRDDQCVVAHDDVVRESHVGLGRARRLAVQGMANEERVERRLAAIERIDGVSTLQLFDAQRWRHLAAVEHARFVEHAREARQRLRRRVQGGMERLPLRGVEAEPLTVR